MQIGIRNKLKLISLLPILLLLGFASYFLYQSTNNYLRVQTFQDRAEYNVVLNDLITQLAKERGMTSIYVASNGGRVKDSLAMQRNMVDKQLSVYRTYNRNHPNIKEDKAIKNLLNQLPQKRKQVDALKIDFNSIFFKYYSVLIKAILDEIEQTPTNGLNNEIANEAKAFTSFAKAKEYSGIERGYMSYILTRYTKMSDSELQRWIHLIGESDAYKYAFIQNKELKRKIRYTLSDEHATNIFNEVASARIEILHSINDGYYSIDPTLWFNINSQKINILVHAQKEIFSSLKQEISQVSKQELYVAVASATLWFISLILAIVGLIVAKEITQNIKNLENILQGVAQSTNQELDINLDTVEGTAKAYTLLQNIIDETRHEQKRAEEASEAKSLFLANMSHEIRTPLNGIVGFTDLLKNTELKGEQKEFVSIIEKSSENLLEIINNILDLSKIESNKVEVENIVFNPIEEFENAVEVYAVKAAEKNVNLGFFIDPALNQPIKGDPTKIKEILINLLSNAVKFTNHNGSINVEIQRIVSEEPEKCSISFSVEDTGVGISPDKQAHIFEAFSQADTSVTRKFGGTGLGLTISAKYAELMGGHLNLESELGKGTRFYFTLEFDALPKMNEDMQGAFGMVTIAMFLAPGTFKKQDEYIQQYLKYFGAEYIPFSSVEELIRISSGHKAQALIVDADYASDSDLAKIGKSPLHSNVIIKSTQQKRIETIRTNFEKVIYEPVNATKMIAILKEATSAVVRESHRPTINIENIAFNAKALVAEDNTINQKLIKRTLEDLGLKVELADNGLEAFEKRRNDDFDIVFMDISMPVMDGVEATHEILDYEEDENIPHIPIIALTANALKGDRERFLAEGLDEYTTKPLIREEIVTILKKFLSDRMHQKESGKEKYLQPEIKPTTLNPEPEPVISFDMDRHEESENKVEPKEKEVPAIEKSAPTKEASKKKPDTIVVLKKSTLEAKIFANMLQELGYNIKIAANPKELVEKIDDMTGLVFIDKESDDINLQVLNVEIKGKNPDIALILMTDPSNEITAFDRNYSDEVIVNLLNRDLVRLIVEKFMKKEG